ncbi:unnamed protein product [Amoebophrya sp. A120]|nr:unnamed protein product [Amoebophrya sp. A120]|eukprot:GSA120T00000094001.1
MPLEGERGEGIVDPYTNGNEINPYATGFGNQSTQMVNHEERRQIALLQDRNKFHGDHLTSDGNQCQYHDPDGVKNPSSKSGNSALLPILASVFGGILLFLGGSFLLFLSQIDWDDPELREFTFDTFFHRHILFDFSYNYHTRTIFENYTCDDGTAAVGGEQVPIIGTSGLTRRYDVLTVYDPATSGYVLQRGQSRQVRGPYGSKPVKCVSCDQTWRKWYKLLENQQMTVNMGPFASPQDQANPWVRTTSVCVEDVREWPLFKCKKEATKQERSENYPHLMQVDPATGKNRDPWLSSANAGPDDLGEPHPGVMVSATPPTMIHNCVTCSGARGEEAWTWNRELVKMSPVLAETEVFNHTLKRMEKVKTYDPHRVIEVYVDIKRCSPKKYARQRQLEWETGQSQSVTETLTRIKEHQPHGDRRQQEERSRERDPESRTGFLAPELAQQLDETLAEVGALRAELGQANAALDNQLEQAGPSA